MSFVLCVNLRLIVHGYVQVPARCPGRPCDEYKKVYGESTEKNRLISSALGFDIVFDSIYVKERAASRQ